MARRSTLEGLPEDILNAVAAAIKSGRTIDEIVELIERKGETRSRSAVGRYTKSFREIADRQRDIETASKAFGAEFGAGDNEQTRLMVQMFNSMVTQAILPIAAGESEALDPLDLSRLAKAMKDGLASRKIAVDTEAAIRKDEREKNAAKATQAARDSGASDETIAAIKRKLLGISE